MALRGIDIDVPRALTNPHPIHTDVVVIGAGAAGLAATRSLLEEGWNVEVLEASNRYGGRLKKNDNLADFPIDIGGEWLHEQPSMLNDVAGEDATSEITMVKYNPQLHEFWREDGKLYPYTYASVDYKFKDYCWYDFLDEYFAQAGYNGTSVADQVNLNCKVNEVDDQEEKIKVKCEDGREFHSDYLIVAVPLTVLQDNDIRFIPDLPRYKKENLGKITMPPALKVFLKFTEHFYVDAFEFQEDHNHDLGDRMFYDEGIYQDTDDNIVGVFAIGTPAEHYVNLSDEDIVKKVISELDIVYNGRATATFTGNYVVQNWEKEPYIRGSYSYYNQGYDALRKVAKPIQNYIFFAGEYAPVDEEHGYAHSAFKSGQAAAYQILNGIKSSFFLCSHFKGKEC